MDIIIFPSQNLPLSSQASPGNLQQLEEVLFGREGEEEVTASVLAISCQLKDGLRHVGVAYWDVTQVQFGVAEFGDNDHFSNLEVSTVFIINSLTC